MNFDEALNLLERRQEAKWKLGLSRIEGLLASLKNPQNDTPIVHVAGTNGKGSFCSILASILSAAGLRVGLFASPHLVTPRERICVDGNPISEEDFGSAVGDAVAAEPEEATYFELITAAAFLHFKRVGVDIAVVEVGLGGRLDATNTVSKPLLSVITSIAHDHRQHLGSTLAEIAGEKCGILREDVVCLCGEDAYEPLKVIRRRAYEAAAPLIVHRNNIEPVQSRWEEGLQVVRSASGELLEFGMLGNSARGNLSLVFRGVEELRSQGFPISPEAISAGVRAAHVAGRFDVRREGERFLVLDGAHNPAAMQSFCENWERSPFSKMESTFLISMLADKDIDALLAIAAPRIRRAICSTPPSRRGLSGEELAKRLSLMGVVEVSIVDDPLEAVREWRRSAVRVGAVVGSFYSIGRILSEEGVTA
ncbi:MAG: tetrahydrofolate synthase [Elusimicrobia bacterium]|nr:MAG: tetrahydrofolate synthase [Elusimicrobiota bacterium]